MPPTHCICPNSHSPTSVPHWAPAAIPSSAVPLQSLSIASQTSALGGLAFMHFQPVAPPQVRKPLLHGAGSVPLPVHSAPCGKHHVSGGSGAGFRNVQQLPASIQQPF